MKTAPILFLIFNRPDLTAQSFETIRSSRPSRLFVAADGPRLGREGELELCSAARQVATQVDWPCEVNTLFRETNLGCGRAVSEAITWFFEHVDEGIILEDDCIPNPSFYNYCSNLLERYRDDKRVMVVSGNNFQDGQWRGDGDYYFSKYPHCWGWATWKRAWKHFDLAIAFWEEFKESGLLKSYCSDSLEREYWEHIFDRVARGEIDSWAYPWTLCVWSQSGMSTLPNRNLVTNIGFGDNATHTQAKSVHANLSTLELNHFHPPSFVARNIDADQYTNATHFATPRVSHGESTATPHWTRRLKRRIRTWILGSK